MISRAKICEIQRPMRQSLGRWHDAAPRHPLLRRHAGDSGQHGRAPTPTSSRPNANAPATRTGAGHPAPPQVPAGIVGGSRPREIDFPGENLRGSTAPCASTWGRRHQM
jgi:hypothetical protein